MAFPSAPGVVHQTLSFASSTATTLVPKAVAAWRNSTATTSSAGSSSAMVMMCTCCQELKEKEDLLLLPDCFRCNGFSSFVCSQCHGYIGQLLEAVDASQGSIQAWNFQPQAPVNMFDLYLSRMRSLPSDAKEHQDLARVLPFIPKLVLDMTLAGTTFLEFEEATVVIVDVSGYTALAEELAVCFGEGNVVGQASGAEALVSEGLNHYFQELVKNVHSYGGDVIKFAGDALICLFTPDKTREGSVDEEALRTAARNAVFCATVAAHSLTHTVSISSSSQKLLTCHCGVATGRVIAWSVGDTERREVLLTGETLLEAGQALDKATAHSVVIDKRTYSLSSDWLISEALFSNGGSKSNAGTATASASSALSSTNGPNLDKARKLLGQSSSASLARSSTVSLLTKHYKIEMVTPHSFVASTAPLEQAMRDLEDKLTKVTSASLLAFVGRHVPKPAKGPQLLNEMRRVTTVFTKFFQVGLIESSVSLQELFRECQRIVTAQGGLIRQFIVDDKGCVLISVFGVASYTDVDDSARALSAAVTLAHDLAVPTSSGVATGVVFVGIVGWQSVRCEFAVVGDSVNLAARLMSLASKAGEREVRCDEATATVSSDSIAFSELEPVMLKGKSKLTRVFVPSIARPLKSQPSLVITKSVASLLPDISEHVIGRQDVQMTIKQFVKDARRGGTRGHSTVLLVVGKTGMGKSKMLSWAEHELEKDACVLKVESQANLSQWVECAASKSLGENPSADIESVRAVIASKLKEGRYRTSLASISVEDTPLSISEMIALPPKTYRRSVSFTASPAANAPMSPSSRGIMPLRLVNKTRSSRMKDEVESWLSTTPRPARAGSIAAQEAMVWLSPTPPRPARTGSIAAQEAIPEQRSMDSTLPSILRGHPTDQILDWLLSSGAVLTPNDADAKHKILEMLFLSFVRDLLAQYRQVVLLLDDVDGYVDSFVRAFVMCSQEPGACLIATSRTDDPRVSKRRQVVQLQALSSEDIQSVVQERFNFSSCPASVWDFVINGGAGNPQMACEYFRALLRQQFIAKKEQGVYQLSEGKTDEDLLKVTPLEGSILNSFDTDLTPFEKDLIRRCAIICSAEGVQATVSIALLRNVDDSSSVDLLDSTLCRLMQGDAEEAYLQVVTRGEYIFSSEVVRSVIYRTMTFAERSRIHLKVAQWLQASGGWDLSKIPLIVHHLIAAGERRQAFDTLWSICALLLREGPFSDAMMFLSRAIDVAKTLQAHELVEPREIAELRISLVLAQASREGRLSESNLALIVAEWNQQRPSSNIEEGTDVRQSNGNRGSSDQGTLSWEEPRMREATVKWETTIRMSESALLDFRITCVAQIWCAFSVLGDATLLSIGFDRLLATLPISQFPAQRLLLSMLCSALSAPLKGKGPARRLDVSLLERTVDVALQLASEDIDGVGTLATAQALLLLGRPFVAERMARNALTKLRDASFGSVDRLAFPALAPHVHCLQVACVAQSLCGGLAGAVQSLEKLIALSDKLELVKLLAWSRCSSSLLTFKLKGKVGWMEDDPVMIIDNVSEMDSLLAMAGRALSNRQEGETFNVSAATMDLLRTKRQFWWLGDLLETMIYCGLINRAEWTLSLVTEFFNFVKFTLRVALPVAYRVEALVRAQRGEDYLALKAIVKARREARRHDLLFEEQLSDFIHRRVFSDQEEEGPDDFRMFGCSNDFATCMATTLKAWVANNNQPNRWAVAKKQRVDRGSFMGKMVRSCFGRD